MACKLPVGSVGLFVFLLIDWKKKKEKSIGKFFVIKNNPSVICID